MIVRNLLLSLQNIFNVMQSQVEKESDTISSFSLDLSENEAADRGLRVLKSALKPSIKPNQPQQTTTCSSDPTAYGRLVLVTPQTEVSKSTFLGALVFMIVLTLQLFFFLEAIFN